MLKLIHEITSNYISCTSNYSKDMIQAYSKVLPLVHAGGCSVSKLI